MQWRNDYDSAVTYAKDDVVLYNNEAYIALRETNRLPSSAGQWIKLSNSNPNGIQYAEVQVDNDQILHLTTVPIVLIPAPGIGLAVMIHSIWGIADTRNGAYVTGGGINGNSDLNILFASEVPTDSSGAIYGSVQASANTVEALLGDVGLQYFTRGVWPNRLPTGAIASDMENEDVVLYNDVDEWNGGHASNTLSISIWFSIVPTIPFGA